MKRTLLLAALAAFATGCDACTAGTIAAVTVIDRDTGMVLPLHYARGAYWVAGRPGANYAIGLRNNTGARILAVTSVDGVNVISGATASWEQSGYVLPAGESYQVTGWRKSNSEVAAFTFTDSPNSYAERTGRPANVGVIGVALFREQSAPPEIAYDRSEASARDSARPAQEAASAQAGASLSAGAAGNLASPAPAAKLGTGHGEREGSFVQETQFRRQQSEPNELIRIRYDSLENLVAMGIIRRPRPWVPAVNPFPDSRAQQFVADPPG
jgi:hypothetical protein